MSAVHDGVVSKPLDGISELAGTISEPIGVMSGLAGLGSLGIRCHVP